MDSEREEFLLEHIRRLGDIIEQTSKIFCANKRELTTLRAKYERAINLIASIEFEGARYDREAYWTCCPECDGIAEHRTDCELAAILAESQEKP